MLTFGSQMGLASISDSVLEPLAGLTPIPVVEKDVPFEPRDPSLKLFLGNNQLSTFPSALLNLQHLTVLSLRNNKLTELPPAIAKLTNLTTLNIANNRLRHLPGELIDLMECASGLHTLNIHPNPFFQPKHRQYILEDDFLEYKYECRTRGRGTHGFLVDRDRGENFTLFTTALRARTPVQFSNSAGHVLSKFIFPDMAQRLTDSSKLLETEDFEFLAMPQTVKQHLESLGQSKRSFRPKGPSSLLATAMRVAAHSKDADTLPDLLRTDGCPSHLADPLERTITVSKMGGQHCSVCKRETLCPVTEWIEFREIRSTTVEKTMTASGGSFETRIKYMTISGREDEAWVPFLRRGCSWACTPIVLDPSDSTPLTTPTGMF